MLNELFISDIFGKVLIYYLIFDTFINFYKSLFLFLVDYFLWLEVEPELEQYNNINDLLISNLDQEGRWCI